MPIKHALIALTALLIVCHTSHADDIEIEEWEFTWLVQESGEAKFEITKTNDALYCYISEDYKGMRLSPSDAEKVGAKMVESKKETDALKKLGGERKKTVDAGDGYSVTYIFEPEGGTSVYVRKKDSFSGGVFFSVKDSRALGRSMTDAQKLAKKLDEKINP